MREVILLWILHYIFIPLFGLWYGGYLNKLRSKGEFGRKSFYE